MLRVCGIACSQHQRMCFKALSRNFGKTNQYVEHHDVWHIISNIDQTSTPTVHGITEHDLAERATKRPLTPRAPRHSHHASRWTNPKGGRAAEQNEGPETKGQRTTSKRTQGRERQEMHGLAWRPAR